MRDDRCIECFEDEHHTCRVLSSWDWGHLGVCCCKLSRKDRQRFRASQKREREGIKKLIFRMAHAAMRDREGNYE